MDFSTYVGGAATVLASLSYIPQVRKAWPRGSTEDLSLITLVVLTAGLALWVAYGVLRGDGVVIAVSPVQPTLKAATSRNIQRMTSI